MCTFWPASLISCQREYQRWYWASWSQDYHFLIQESMCSFFILFSFSYSIFRMLYLNYSGYSTVFLIAHSSNFMDSYNRVERLFISSSGTHRVSGFLKLSWETRFVKWGYFLLTMNYIKFYQWHFMGFLKTWKWFMQWKWNFILWVSRQPWVFQSLLSWISLICFNFWYFA